MKLRIESGTRVGETLEIGNDLVRIGRAGDSDLVLPDALVSGDHARIFVKDGVATLRDLRSTNGTAVRRRGEPILLGEGNAFQLDLEAGDVIELGGEGGISLRLIDDESIVLDGDPSAEDRAQVVAVRPLDAVTTMQPVEEPSRLRALYKAQSNIGLAEDLSDVLVAIADAALELVPRATHATLVLRSEDEDEAKPASYVPVLTRVRGEPKKAGPIPITRSVFRKVVTERAAVLAADAPQEVGQSESLMGAQIRSTIGVPLFRGEEILGVLQVDNRESPGVFTTSDLDVIAVLAHHASLAVANARLVRRLRAAEERLRKENTFLKRREETRRTGGRTPQQLLGDSNAMKAVNTQISKVVDTRVTVLIEGETGTGKEVIASAIHYRSRRREKLFVGQNCAALPEQLLESELFGHKKGAFTGAHEEKKGLFEIADGGTLFLDEIGEIPLSLQSKLLRALQEGEIRPVGATQEKRVDVRIVAATNRNLEKEVAAGRFREDLYYRLKVFPINVPPLRERRDDIPLLAEYFLKRYEGEMGKAASGFSQQTMELLVAYQWPGNVRELQNEVQRLMIQVEPGEIITPEYLSPRVREVDGVVERVRPAKGTLKEMMDHIERCLLIEALREHDNNKTAAARTLGITREGLHKKLRAFGL